MLPDDDGGSTKPSDFYDKLARKRDREIEQRQRELLPLRQQSSLGGITKRRLGKVADGLPGAPVGSAGASRIDISSRIWARLIVRAACAFDSLPGFAALKKHPIPDTQYGIRAGERIFVFANRTRDVEKVAKEIDLARKSLGQYPSERARGNSADYDYGIWLYFRQLDRFFDGVNWRPSRVSQRRSIASRRGKPRGVPTPTSKALEKALRDLQGMNRDAELSVQRVIDLYGLEQTSAKAFVDSSKYVQRHGQPRKPWQLPRRRVSAADADAAKPRRFQPHMRWPVKVVRKAVEGWIERPNS